MDNMDVVIDEDFSKGMDNWWVEGGKKVWVEDRKLYMEADSPDIPGGHVCTAWCKTPISGDVVIQYDAHVLSSSIDANNINFFFHYSDPSGTSLFETRADRSTGDYKRYHSLNGYIVTFLNDFRNESGTYPDGTTKARVRIRRCPGFELLNECYRGKCQKGTSYHLTIAKQSNEISFRVNGEVFLTTFDPNPLSDGIIGLRSFRTCLWWANICVRVRSYSL